MKEASLQLHSFVFHFSMMPRLKTCKWLCQLTSHNAVIIILLVLTHLIIHVTAQCSCPIQEETVCYQCRCELTPENKMAINCKDRGLTEVPTFTYSSTAFVELTLAGNQISSIPASRFRELHSLKHLDLKGNRISSIDTLAFEGLDGTLEELLLEVNSITDFPTDAFSGLQKLKNLSATGFDLSASGLPSGALANANNLVELVLSNNRLQSFPADALSGQVNSLRSLVLDSNLFSSVPSEALNTLQVLEKLSIVGNTGLNNLPENTFQGVHLTSLDLSQNGLSSIHSRAFTWLESTLEILEMRSCQLRDNMLPPLQHLSSLRQLDLSSNAIANIPSSMFTQLTNIEVLQLHQNQLHTITGAMLSGLNQLRLLDLSGNSLANIEDEAFASTPMLRQLTIGLNPNLSPLLPDRVFHPIAATLEVLHLEGTGFTESQWHLIRNLTKLKTLKLDQNRITSLPEMGFRLLQQLENIYLEGNLLSMVTQQQVFGPNANLELINFNNNNLTTLDQCTFFEFQQMNYYKLGLTNNPLHCDCRLKWLLQELKRHEAYDFLKYAVGWTCASPSSVQGKKFAYEISESDLVCDPPVTFPPCTDLTPVTTTTTRATSTTTIMPDEPFAFTLNITVISDTSMLLHWLISDSVLDDLLGFRIQHRAMPDGMDQYVDLGSEVRSYELTDLTPAAEHLICVIALGIQQTGNTICDSAMTLPVYDEVSGEKNDTLVIILSCVLCALIIVSIVIIVCLVKRRRRKRAAGGQDNPFGIRIGYESKRFSRPTTPNISTMNLNAFDNQAIDHKCEGFSREEQNRILGQMTQLGANTLSTLSTASSTRYIQDRPKPSTPKRSSSYGVSDDADKHIYWEIPDEGAYQNEAVDLNLNNENQVRIPNMNTAGITV